MRPAELDDYDDGFSEGYNDFFAPRDSRFVVDPQGVIRESSNELAVEHKIGFASGYIDGFCRAEADTH